MTLTFDNNGHAENAGELRVYYFDGNTKEFVGWSDEHIAAGVSLPGNSTDVAPEIEADGFVSVFTGAQWEQREDHRKQTVYRTDNRTPVVVDYIGKIKDGYTLIKPSTSFDKWDGTQWVLDADAKHIADVAANAEKKSALLTEASQVIAPLKDALDGDYIDDSDKPVLTAWQKYRYELTKVDPVNPVWPSKPAE
ncbi:tail fiber assembly protein [Citrobacter portucalensis]|uniref:Tail fiber assembly protein n=1 Tax=Citrobacter portucalensis TaxID=1639133 RepID=A0AAW9EIS9_9ENTR|nr:tail fiber assembly protein [Citrobacter portucalensis]MDX7147602.1 tail fiber assembly protein [Citrobacter portucalensis]